LFAWSPSSLATAQQQQDTTTATGGGEEVTTTPSQPPTTQAQDQQQQMMPKSCGNNNSDSSGPINDTDVSGTTTGMVGANNNSSNTFLYQNPEYGIQILCPQNWIYGEGENPVSGEFLVYFTSLPDVQQSQTTGEKSPIVSVATRKLPSPNLDLHLFAGLNLRNLTTIGNKIISINLNTTLSDMPAFEVVYVDPNGTMFLQDWTIQGDRAYGVIYTSHESKFEQFLLIAQDMISSFTITNASSDRTTTYYPPTPSERSDSSNNRTANSVQGPNNLASSTT